MQREVVGERYVLGDLLGYGATGSTWLGWDAVRQGVVAVKVVREGDARGIVEAFEATKHLVHPHLLLPAELVRDQGALAVVMPRAGGGSLTDVVRRHGPLPGFLAAEILRQVASALVHVHRHGTSHGGITPSDVLLAPTGVGVPRVFLADFGPRPLAARIRAAADDRLDDSAFHLPHRGAYDPAAADVHALARVGEYLVTGCWPRRGVTPGLFGSLGNLPAGLWSVLAATVANPEVGGEAPAAWFLDHLQASALAWPRGDSPLAVGDRHGGVGAAALPLPALPVVDAATPSRRVTTERRWAPVPAFPRLAP